MTSQCLILIFLDKGLKYQFDLHLQEGHQKLLFKKLLNEEKFLFKMNVLPSEKFMRFILICSFSPHKKTSIQNLQM